MSQITSVLVWGCLFFGVLLGRYVGDAETIQNCATKGEAKMFLGGTIICEPKKGVVK